jgi:hypothetical protein
VLTQEGGEPGVRHVVRARRQAACDLAICVPEPVPLGEEPDVRRARAGTRRWKRPRPG